ncbi:MAG TPA: L-threonylcarbamoyladenylate synthase [Longimicrobiales bacterium]
MIDHLKRDGVIAYPTETVYGFGGLITAPALRRVAELKSRAENKPFLLLVSNPAQCAGLEWNEEARKLAQHFWPGPLTLALRATSGEFPAQVLSESQTVAVRETPHPGLRTLLDVLGQPITSSSANLPRQAPAADAADVAIMLREMQADDVLLLDGGRLAPAEPSTLIDCSVVPPRVLRQGGIAVAKLREVVEQLDA